MAVEPDDPTWVPPIQFPRMTMKPENEVDTTNVQFKNSRTKGTGKGLHAEVAIKAGKLVARIKKPLFNIVKRGYLDFTCDNCMATQREGGAMRGACYSTVDSNGLSSPQHLMACNGCKVLYYCNDKCKNEAWANHHKAECAVLANLPKQSHEYIEHESVRLVIRLLSLRATGDSYEDLCNDLKNLTPESLPERYAGLCWSGDSVGWRAAVGTVGKYTRSGSEVLQQGMSEAKETYIAAGTNGIDIAHPKINIDGSCEHDNSYIVTGTCFDFFTSKVNHSCAPNCIWVFNKSELQLRTMKDVRKNEELMVAYDAYFGSRGKETVFDEWGEESFEDVKYDPGTILSHWTGEAHKMRRIAIKERCGFDCRCPFCVGGHFGPEEGSELDNLVRAELSKPVPVNDMDLLDQVIDLARTHKFGPNRFPMKTVNERLRALQINSGLRADVLRTSLTQYFLIEPKYNIKVPLDQRLTTFRILTEYSQTPGYISVGSFAMKLKLVRDTAKCFGPDSDVVISLDRKFRMELVEEKRPDISTLEMKFAGKMQAKLLWAGFNERQIEKAKPSELL
ncbi:hypothetical protein DL98DRAFT_579326 [Cadophora sp. DSE1049]|nr:hypothetical protein DL98DRAFT_579326 [Cadophora sp. DSE1049]